MLNSTEYFFLFLCRTILYFYKVLTINFSVLIAVLKPTLFYLKTCLHGLPDRCACSNLVPSWGHGSAGSAFWPQPWRCWFTRRQVPSEVEEWSVFSINVSFMSMVVKGHSALRDPVCSSFVCCFSRTLYSLSVPGKQEWAELHAVLRTEIMRKRTCLDSLQWLPSTAPFSDLFLKGNLFSYAPLTQDMECFLALWRLLFAWLCFCSIF